MNTAVTVPITRYDIFVPGDFPQHSYVRRVFKHRRTGEIIDPEVKIKEALKQRGIIAQVVGPSKSGKTRAVENCVGERNLVSIAGSQIYEGTSIWSIVLRLLRLPVSTQNSKSVDNKFSADFTGKASAGVVVSSVEMETAVGLEHGRSKESSLDFESDHFQSAVEALIERKMVLFLDDFHTIPEVQQPTVAAQLKAAAQVGVKICLAEVPHHSDSTISALPDLTGRVQKIEFQYWGFQDLHQIAVLGFQKLGMQVASAALEAFTLESAGSPQLMQLICLNAAAYAGVDEARSVALNCQFTINDIRSILLKTHGAVDRDKIFGILDQGPDERGKPRKRFPVIVLGDGDNYEITLAAISLSPPSSSLSWSGSADNLYRRIEKICTESSNKPAKGQITRAIEQMQDLAVKHLPRQPIIEWSEATGLHILDPYFIFHLRWSEKYEPVRKQVEDEAMFMKSWLDE